MARATRMYLATYNRQMDRQTNRRTDKQTDRQMDRQIYNLGIIRASIQAQDMARASKMCTATDNRQTADRWTDRQTNMLPGHKKGQYPGPRYG